MSAGAATAPAPCAEQAPLRRERRPCARPRGLTLGELLTRAHEDMHAHGKAGCPVCGDALERRPHGIRCAGCGSRLL